MFTILSLQRKSRNHAMQWHKLCCDPVISRQSGPTSEGALNYKIKVWPLCASDGRVLTLRIFTAKSSLGNTINFPRSIHGHWPIQVLLGQLPHAHAWANRMEKVFALLLKRIWVKTQFSRAKHQTSVRRCANRGKEEAERERSRQRGSRHEIHFEMLGNCDESPLRKFADRKSRRVK